jgi:hypothetical protein
MQNTMREVIVVIAMFTTISSCQVYSGVTVAGAPLCGNNANPNCQGAALYSPLNTYVWSVPSAAQIVTGVTPIVPWNLVDIGQAHDSGPTYSWPTLDGYLLAYLTAGVRTINIIIAPISPDANLNTPLYVFYSEWSSTLNAPLQQMANCGNYPGDNTAPPLGSLWNTGPLGSPDTSGVPIPYEVPWMTAYQEFITQFIQHFSSSCTQYSSDCGNANTITPSLGYVRFGMTIGGEANALCNSLYPGPDTNPFPTGGYSNFKEAYVLGGNNGTGSPSYIQTMTNYMAQQAKKYNVGWTLLFDTHPIGSTPDNQYADLEAQYAASQGYAFGTNGLQISDLANYAAGDVNISGASCQSDWCRNVSAARGQPSATATISNTAALTGPSTVQ